MKLFHKKSGESRSLVSTLAAYLFVFSLTALLLVSGIQLYFYWVTYEEALAKNQKIIARDAANRVSSFIQDKISVLEATIWTENPVELPEKKQKYILRSLLGLQPSFRLLEIADTNNSIKVSVSRRSSLYSQPEYYKYRSAAYKVSRNTKLEISPVFIDKITNEPLILISLPILNALSEFEGVLYAQINLKFMWELVDQISIGETGYVYVVDNTGSLIAFGDASRVLKNENLKNITPVSVFCNNHNSVQSESINVFTGIKNQKVVGTYAPLNTPDWAVITELPITEAYRKVFIEVIISGITLLLAAVSIALLGFHMAKKLAIPVIELMNTSSLIAKGNREIKAKVKGPKEIEALADAFNSMTSQLNKSLTNLEEKYTEIKSAQKKLKMSQFSIDRANDAIFWINKEAGFIYVNDMSCSSLGYSREELLQLGLYDVAPDFSMKNWQKEWESFDINKNITGKKRHSLHKHKDGSVFPVEISYTHIWFEETELLVAHVRDISETKKAEEVIKQKTEELDKFFTSALDLLCIADTQGYFRRLNLEWEKTLGYSVDELVGKKFLDYVHPDDIDDTIMATQKLENQQSILNFTKRFRCSDGTYRWIEWRSFAAGDIIYSAARDITKRIKIEDQLKLSQFSIDQSMDAVFWMNKEAEFTYVNEQACKSLGYTNEELLQLKLWDIDKFYPKERWHSNWENYQLNRQGGFERVETFHTRRDGSTFPVEVYSRHIWFGDVEFHLANVRDISERVKSEMELRTKESQLMLALETANLANWDYIVADDLFIFNDQFYLLFKTSAQEVGGYKMTSQEYTEKFVATEDKYVVGESIRKAIETDDPDYHNELEHKVIFNDDSSGFINVKFNIVKDENGKTIRLYGVIQDITERKIYEQALLAAKENAEKSDKLKSEFLAQISHEIRTPINTILSFTGLLKSELMESKDDDLKESFPIIDGAGRRLIRTIDLILNMSQLQTNTYEAEPKLFNLYNAIIRELSSEYSQAAELKGLHFKIINNSHKTDLFADEYTVLQIFDNLINNAIKYTHEGKIEVKIFNDSGSRIIVEVSDTGIGISNEFIPNIFTPFVQEEGGYTRKYEGNGLGLALVKKYCDLNNAQISVQSQKGNGTTFTVVFNSSGFSGT